jgi:hypothetical protein
MLSAICVSAQQKHPVKKGMFYFSAGSHRAFYSPSTIRLVSNGDPSFDFTLEKLKARDDQGIKFHTSPQYSYNLGYYSFKKNIGIEYQFDHVKYIVIQGQVARLKGHIEEEHYNADTVIHSGFVQLEHTDGANYAMLNLVKWKNLSTSKNQKRSLDLFLKAGGGIVIPKTNSTIMGKHYDNQYAISGYVIGVEPGIRYNFLKNFFASASIKGAYANYNKFRIADGSGSQQWFSAQFNLMVGVQVSR